MREVLLRLRWAAGGVCLALALVHFAAAMLAWRIGEYLQQEPSDYDFGRSHR